jgi:ATP-dependent DNA helicase PIF1
MPISLLRIAPDEVDFMPGHEYGKISDKTKKIRSLIDKVSCLGESDSSGISEAEDLAEYIEQEFTDENDIFVSSAYKILKGIIADGEIDNQERKLLKGLAEKLTNPVSDCPINEIDGRSFVLTGDFSIDGGKDTAREMLQSAGGCVKSGVSKKTDYVVVGKFGSSAWAFGSYGTKVEKALGLQLTGSSGVQIISEDALMKSLAATSQAAIRLLDEKERRFNEQWKSAKVVSNGFSGLTEGQQRAFDLVKSGANLYLSGLGGTGKSYVLERMIKWAEGSGKNVIVCAPTGIAALNVGGSTIHRALEIGPNTSLELHPDPHIRKDSPLVSCDIMIVDEISMCRMDLFDYLSLTLKKAALIRAADGRNKAQLIVVGDFCQLPPVVPAEEKRILDRKYGFDVGGGYPFMGFEWNSWNFEKVELVEAIRQRDADFVAALNACRVGDLKGVRWIQDHAAKEPDKDAIVLCGKNAQADRENTSRLRAINAPEVTYTSLVTGTVTSGDMPTAERLTLKPGARVMAVCNNSPETYMNGTLGTVLHCGSDYVDVCFDKLGTTRVQSNRWDITVPDIVNGRTKTKVIGTFTQIPLKLAWAITIHKSQGQTFAAVDIYPDCWECGQLYTALSRVTNINGLYLEHGISDDFLRASKDVMAFLEGRYQQPVANIQSPQSSMAPRKKSDIRETPKKTDKTSKANACISIAEEKEVDKSQLEKGIPTRCGGNVLKRAGICSVGQLNGMTEKELLAISGMGMGKIHKLMDYLMSEGVLADGQVTVSPADVPHERGEG